MRDIHHFVNGQTLIGTSGRFGDVFNPNTGEVQARVQFATVEEMDLAVKAAAAAQTGWAQTNPQRRARVMFDFKRLLEANMTEMAELLSSEHGKVVADSKGDIQRGLEVIEFACGVPHLLKGEYTEGAGPSIDLYCTPPSLASLGCCDANRCCACCWCTQHLGKESESCSSTLSLNARSCR